MNRHRLVTVTLATLATLVPAVACAAESSPGSDAAAGAFVGLFGVMWVLIMVFQLFVWGLVLVSLVLWIIAVIDVVQRNDWEFPNALEGRPASSNDKTMWLLIVLLAGSIGAIVYYFTIMKKYPLKKIRTGGGPTPQAYSPSAAPAQQYAPPAPLQSPAPPAPEPPAAPVDPQ